MQSIWKNKVILASQSPRRRELMGLLFDAFEVCVTDTDETLPAGIAPARAVELLAQKKARAAARDEAEALVIGADTVVSIEERILGKPADAKAANEMLRLLSGRSHEVYTGVALCCRGLERVFSCRTVVTFAPLDDAEIRWYISTGEPFDKAGGYGIQGAAARYIRAIQGDYFNVMGLPVNAIYENLGCFTK